MMELDRQSENYLAEFAQFPLNYLRRHLVLLVVHVVLTPLVTLSYGMGREVSFITLPVPPTLMRSFYH